MDEPWQLIWNPTAGLGRAKRLRARIETLLNVAGIPFEFHRTRGAGHASEIAAARRAAGRRRFLIGGGDGSINEVVNGLFDDDISGDPPLLAALPLGSGNDWLRSRGLPTDLEAMIRLLKTGRTTPGNIGRVHATGGQRPWQRYFVNVAGFGLDVRVLETLPEWRPAALRYAVGLTRAFASYRVGRIRFEHGGRTHDFEALSVICALGSYSGGGMRLTPHADEAADQLAITVVDDLPWWRLLLSFHQIYDGSIGERPEVHFMHADQIEFTEPRGALIETDGEIVGPTPARIVIHRGALRTLEPPDANARS